MDLIIWRFLGLLELLLLVDDAKSDTNYIPPIGPMHV